MRASEVVAKAMDTLEISEAEQAELLPSGSPRAKNQAFWARLYLVKAGYLRSAKRGVWALTEKGSQLDLDSFNPRSLEKSISKQFQEERKKAKEQKETLEVNDTDIPLEPQEDDLLQVLRELPPDGFERLCKRLLVESGFEQVEVTGRSGDSGIDGHGLLKINPFVSFNVLFQCKRYAGSVGSAQIRDFRGAMQGRADKGIIITTGSFTSEAKKEARRDGVPPIELVDGDDLVALFQDLELGVKARKVYDVDQGFFGDFK
jgi:restriction system protein